MNQIIVDQSLRSKLHNFSEPLDLCDETGQVLARLVPIRMFAPAEIQEPPISEEELQRREAETESYSTAEMLRYLETLPCITSAGSDPR
jgi:hypothetical protein